MLELLKLGSVLRVFIREMILAIQPHRRLVEAGLLNVILTTLRQEMYGSVHRKETATFLTLIESTLSRPLSRPCLTCTDYHSELLEHKKVADVLNLWKQKVFLEYELFRVISSFPPSAFDELIRNVRTPLLLLLVLASVRLILSALCFGHSASHFEEGGCAEGQIR